MFDTAWAAAREKAVMPKGAWSTACMSSSSSCGARCTEGESASLTASDKHLGRPGAQRQEHVVSCPISCIGAHWIARIMAMITIFGDGDETEVRRGKTNPS